MIDLRLGDCLEVLRTLPDSSVDSLVCDPPCGVSFMGLHWDKHKGGRDQWVAWLTEILAECQRVMKPGAIGAVWSLPRTQHWTAWACEDAGFRIWDNLGVAQVFGSGFPKGQALDKLIDSRLGRAGDREVVGLYQHPQDCAKNKHTPQNAHYQNIEKTFGCVDLAPHGTRLGGCTITAPATPEAQQWDGWRTCALKPGYEFWIRIEKPNLQSPLKEGDKITIMEWCDLVNRVCLLSLSASTADALFKHQSDGFIRLNNEGQNLNSVLENAAGILSRQNGEWSEKMDMFRSQEMGKISLSIVALWNSILGDLCELTSTSTTSMKSNLTTELRTSKLSALESISQNIIHQLKTLPSGEHLNALSVELFLKGSNALSSEALTSSVLSNVLIDIGAIILSSIASIADRFFNGADTIASIVQWLAPESIKSKQDHCEKERPSRVSIADSKKKCGCLQKPSFAAELAWENLAAISQGSQKTPKPGFEFWVLVQKKPDGSIVDNVMKHGVGGVNIDATRVPVDGAITQGRYPANFAMIHHPDCTEDQCHADCPVEEMGRQSGWQDRVDTRSVCTESSSIFRQTNKVETPRPQDFGGTAARYFHQFRYEGKASPRDRSELCRDLLWRRDKDSSIGWVQVSREEYDALPDRDRAQGNIHATVKNTALMDFLVTLATPPGGVVLDPFMGSGSTGVAAVRKGFGFIGIEQEPGYMAIARARIETAKTQPAPKPKAKRPPKPKAPDLEQRVESLEFQQRRTSARLQRIEATGQLSIFG